MSTFWEKKIWGIRYWELGGLFLLYFFFGFVYHMAIYLTSGGTSGLLPNIFYDYGLKAAYTVPIWWFLFKKVPEWSLWNKILFHLAALPVWVILWQQSYYFVSDQLDFGRLRGSAEWWDIYIPGLFYVVQFGVYHAYDFYVRLQRQHELEKDLRQAALRSELSALKAQLNPHFLYNTFNAISASVPPGMEKTRELIADLSDLFRYQLKGSREEVVLLEEELEFVKKYLDLEKERFGNRLKVHFDIDDRTRKCLLPPMILQPLVENAVKHGISHKIEGGVITISTRMLHGNVHLEICDTGMGIKEGSVMNQGVGLSNTRMILEKMYNTQLTLKERKEGGVCVQFKIPMP